MATNLVNIDLMDFEIDGIMSLAGVEQSCNL